MSRFPFLSLLLIGLAVIASSGCDEGGVQSLEKEKGELSSKIGKLEEENRKLSSAATATGAQLNGYISTNKELISKNDELSSENSKLTERLKTDGLDPAPPESDVDEFDQFIQHILGKNSSKVAGLLSNNPKLATYRARDQSTPLHFAMLVADPKIPQANSGDLPLQEDSDVEKIIKAILDAKDIDVNATNLRGCTPLHVGVWKGNLNSVKLLLEAKLPVKCDPNIKDVSDATPAQLAAWHLDGEMGTLLRKHCKTDGDGPRAWINNRLSGTLMVALPPMPGLGMSITSGQTLILGDGQLRVFGIQGTSNSNPVTYRIPTPTVGDYVIKRLPCLQTKEIESNEIAVKSSLDEACFIARTLNLRQEMLPGYHAPWGVFVKVEKKANGQTVVEHEPVLPVIWAAVGDSSFPLPGLEGCKLSLTTDADYGNPSPAENGYIVIDLFGAKTVKNKLVWDGKPASNLPISFDSGVSAIEVHLHSKPNSGYFYTVLTRDVVRAMLTNEGFIIPMKRIDGVDHKGGTVRLKLVQK